MSNNFNCNIPLDRLDFYILDCIINSKQDFSIILDMVQRFTAMRFQSNCEFSMPLNIQNPRPVGGDTDYTINDKCGLNGYECDKCVGCGQPDNLCE